MCLSIEHSMKVSPSFLMPRYVSTHPVALGRGPEAEASFTKEKSKLWLTGWNLPESARDSHENTPQVLSVDSVLDSCPCGRQGSHTKDTTLLHELLNRAESRSCPVKFSSVPLLELHLVNQPQNTSSH